ncbi:MAG: DUF58 domain-containing protein [Hyphomicrobiaceae bacterium]
MVQMQPPLADIAYRLAWRSSSVRSGAHKSRIAGTGGVFRDHASLLDQPDPRRIDIRLSARDPFGRVFVRRFEQLSDVTVVAIIDISGSMGFKGVTRKQLLVADIVSALAASARRIGDPFGVLACGDIVSEPLSATPTRARRGESAMRDAIAAHSPSAHGTQGIREAAARLAGRKKVVFLISDFQMQCDYVEEIFELLAFHDVVPILLSDSAEVEKLPEWGLMQLRDMETGKSRLVVMRPSLKREWKRRESERREELNKIASREGREIFEVRDEIDWDAFSAYLSRGTL